MSGPCRAVASLVAVGSLLLFPVIASAHPGHDGGGVVAGVLHPLTGADHLLAMVAVGMWAAQSRGRALWLMPLTFIASLVVGAILGAAGASVPFVETGILLSILVLGGLLAFAIRPALWVSLPLISAFAFFHGHAHGAEMPAAASLSYGGGFGLGTAALHAAGIGAILATRRIFARANGTASEIAGQIGGVAIAVAGVIVWIGRL